MASHGADGDGVALSLADPVVYPRDVLGSPGGVVPVADDDVGGLDEGPLQVLVGGFPHVAKAGFAAAGVHRGDDAGIAGEPACRVEAIDGADLALDHDGQDVANSGKALEQLDGGGESDPLWATVCYEQPNGHNWIPGRHADDATILVADSVYPMSELELVGLRFSRDGLPTHCCDRLLFSLPEQPPTQVYLLEIQRLVGDTPTAEDCPEAQRELVEQQTGIEIECLEGDQTFSYGIIARPESMTDLQASYFVDDIAGEVVNGPWHFEFTAAQLGL